MTLKNKSIVIALLAVFLFINSSLVGQSIPLLTDPIKIREIEIISNDLELTDVQTESLIDLYDQYLIDFERVRNGEVKTFEDGLTSAAEQFGFMDFNIPERDVVEQLISQGLRAIRAIQRVDKQFFEKIGGMLTETQMKRLKRSQVARELEAYNIIVLEMIGELNRGVRTNLRTVVESNEIETTLEIDELLSTYDQRYLKVAKRSLDAIVEMVNLILDTIDELGIRGLDQQALMMRFLNPESIEDLKSRGEVILKPLQEIAFEMSQLNWKTWNQLDALLQEEDARTIQRQYFSRSYWNSVRGGNAVEKYFGRALAIKDITAEQRASLEEARNTFYSRWKSKSEKHASVLEKSRKYKTIDQMSGEQSGEFDEELDRLDEQRKEFVDSTNSKIESILGAEIVERLQANSNKKTMSKPLPTKMVEMAGDQVDLDSKNVVVIGSTSIDGEEIVIKDGVAYIEGQDGWEEIELEGVGTYSQTTTSKDGKVVTTQISAKDSSRKKEAVQKTKSEPLEGGILIPDPIIPSFPRKAAEILGLDSSGASIVEAVYDDYRDQYKEVYEEAKGVGIAFGTEQELSQGARLKKQTETNKDYAEQVAVLDTIFFDDLAALTGLKREDKNLLMLESHRNRQRTSAPKDPFGWSGGDGDHIDLVNLYLLSTKSDALLSNISNESIHGIHSALQNYDDQVTGAHHQFVKATSDLKLRTPDVVLLLDPFTTYFRPQVVLAFIKILGSLHITFSLFQIHETGKSHHLRGDVKTFKKIAIQNLKFVQSIQDVAKSIVGIDPAITLLFRDEYTHATGIEFQSPVQLPQEWLHEQDLTSLQVTQPWKLFPHCIEMSMASQSASHWNDVFKIAGCNLEIVQTSCCGMGGLFGHQQEFKSQSKKIWDIHWGQHNPEVHNSMVTGYSCYSQAMRFQGVTLPHPLEVLANSIS